ncbi:Peptidyl-prolyl cis-trans isomerase pin4 [Malassezia vespertilionis]|uniref:Peptidyl-prolyl cis-trans isomerase pin4 n=1 Tax=Malassezia vespertilionis TaxID=2020962 RepID=UPI0024B07420|nr:Peptidyl-prolyl cis-trans isomerase pin4 [Malassezia vespertilionis]WFD05535.1 Peptidyl-prolyl cis-trans isomerase pin4 [Malassezia vespertilionis]
MAEKNFVQSFDAMNVGNELPADNGLAEPYAAPNNVPFDAIMSFSPFHLTQPSPSLQDNATANMYSSRFQHLFSNGNSAPGNSVARTKSQEDMFAKAPGAVPDAATPGRLDMLNPLFSAGSANSQGARGTLPFYSNTWGAPSPSSPFGVGSDRLTSVNGTQPTMQLGAGPIRFGGNIPTNTTGETDIIPTAIVIKNIPFNIKREQLLHVIRDLGIPVPYAFNYHFDQGIFRGLAFANFHSPAEANEVVAALNGLDVSGRKLRVEYKKVLQAGEKERIEKEKAIKRLQYPHGASDKDRKKDKPMGAEFVPSSLGMPSAPSRVVSPSVPLLNTFSPPPLAMPHQENVAALDAGSFSNTSDSALNDSLDLNDPFALEVYSRVLLFKDDRIRDELAFSKSLSHTERRIVQLVTQKLGLFHRMVGGADERQVIVTKFELPQRTTPIPLDARDGSSQSTPSAPTILRPDLRSKQSAPDMKRATRDTIAEQEHARARNGLLAHPSLPARRPNSGMREGYAQDPRFEFNNLTPGAGMFGFPFDMTSVPLLPRPNSVDIEHLDQYQNTKSPTPFASSFRSKSPFASHALHHGTGASTPVSPLAHSTGALDTSQPGAALNGLAGTHRPLPMRGMPVDLNINDKIKPRLQVTSHLADAPHSERLWEKSVSDSSEHALAFAGASKDTTP